VVEVALVMLDQRGLAGLRRQLVSSLTLSTPTRLRITFTALITRLCRANDVDSTVHPLGAMYFSERIVGSSRCRYTLLTARLLRVGIDWADRVGLILELTTILPSCRVSPGRSVNVSALLGFVAPPRKVDGNWKNAKSTKRSVTACPVGTFVSRKCPVRSVLALLSQGYTSTSSAFTGRPVSSTTSR
jgi:hypothetical protein